jgi:hypothetical protein
MIHKTVADIEYINSISGTFPHPTFFRQRWLSLVNFLQATFFTL